MRGRDDGSTLPLILVFFAIAAAFIAVAAGATALHLERMRLLSVADGASLAAAESFALADVQVDGGAVTPILHDAQVRSAASDALASSDLTGLDGFRLVSAVTIDGRSATVTVQAVWHPPIVSALLPVSVPVTVSSTAAARFR